MKITALKAQSRNPNRVNVSVDGKYRLSLDVYQVTELNVKVGQEYSEEEMRQLEQASQFGKLYARALEYCLVRPRSIKEMRDYLWRKTRDVKTRSRKTGKITVRSGFSKETTDGVLGRLIEKGYLDDEKFAKFWADNRFIKKGISLRRLKLELRQKGVGSEVIEKLTKQSTRSDKDELGKVIARKKRQYPDQQKLIQYLLRQGFNYEDIKTALGDD